MTKKRQKALNFRRKIAKTMTLDLLLEELIDRGLKIAISSDDGIAKAAKVS